MNDVSSQQDSGKLLVVTQVFQMARSRIWSVRMVGAITGALAAVMLLVAAACLADRDQGALVVMFGFVGLVMSLMTRWLFRAAGRFQRAHITVSDAGLEWYANQCSHMNPGRLHAAQVGWNEVQGVETWNTTNYQLPGGVQYGYIVHTSAGKFAVTSAFWPEVHEIAAAITGQIGRQVDELPEQTMAELHVERHTTSWTITLVHVIGWFSIVCGVAVGCLLVLALVGGADLPLRSLGITLAVCGAMIGMGQSMRRYNAPGGRG